jgi:uncharacterized protein (DUF2235 family)
MSLYAFDGTWSLDREAREYGRNSNVVKFRDAYTEAGIFFSAAAASRVGLVGKLIGGALGTSAADQVRTAFDDLCRAYQDGDRTVDIVGFSRGADLALRFISMIHERGIRDPQSGRPLAKNVPIRFVGLWDAVTASSRSASGRETTFKLPSHVAHCFHALALDERRAALQATRIIGAYEVWFRGTHADIGGGNSNSGLSNIALKWMFAKALAVKLPIDTNKITLVDSGVDQNTPITDVLDPSPGPWRSPGPHDRKHYTVGEVPNGNPVHFTVVEDVKSEQESMKITES